MKGTPLVVLDACVLAKFSLCDTLLPLGNRRGSLTEMVGGDPSGDNPHVGIGSRVAGLFDMLEGLSGTRSRSRARCCRAVGVVMMSNVGIAASFGWTQLLTMVARSCSRV